MLLISEFRRQTSRAIFAPKKLIDVIQKSEFRKPRNKRQVKSWPSFHAKLF